MYVYMSPVPRTPQPLLVVRCLPPNLEFESYLQSHIKCICTFMYVYIYMFKYIYIHIYLHINLYIYTYFYRYDIHVYNIYI